MLLYGNRLFRNENSGVYFAAKSANGVAVGNTVYENLKGLRWSSDSVNGVAADNLVFDNLEIGFARVPRHVHHLHRLVAEDDAVITEHTEDWCFADDHVVALPFVSVQVIRDRRIALWRDYSNMATLLETAPAWWLEHVTSAWAAG